MSDRVRQIQERLDAATRGPWKRRPWKPPGARRGQVMDMAMTRFGCLFNGYSGFNDEADAEFVAHSREDVEYLLKRLARAESKLSRAVSDG